MVLEFTKLEYRKKFFNHTNPTQQCHGRKLMRNSSFWNSSSRKNDTLLFISETVFSYQKFSKIVVLGHFDQFFLSFTFITLPFFPRSESPREKTSRTQHLRARVMKRKGKRVSESRWERERDANYKAHWVAIKGSTILFFHHDPLFCFCFDVTLYVVGVGLLSHQPCEPNVGFFETKKKITYIYIYIKSKISYKY